MAENPADQTGFGDDEDDSGNRTGTLQLLRSEWQLPVYPEILEIPEVQYVQNAEPARSEGKAILSEVSAHLELLCSQTTTDQRHMAMATEDGLKSRMRENRKSGSMRGSDIPLIGTKLKQ